MPKLYLIPVINVLELHNAIMRDWLSGLSEIAIKEHLAYPFRLDRFFSESARHAIIRANDIHDEILLLFNIINPQSVFLDISTDLYELENKYNKRLISPHGFWMEYFDLVSEDINEPSRTLYRIYMNEIIEKNTRVIESKERLPLNVLFYGPNILSDNELIPVYEEALNIVEEFTLNMARAANEIMNLREKPRHLWRSSGNAARIGISYEETEKFYDELSSRIRRLLKYRVREHFVKKLYNISKTYADSYERFLDLKIKDDEIKFSNIKEGLEILGSQSELSEIIILCEPMDYKAIHFYLKQDMDTALLHFSLHEIELTRLFDKMRPFIQKNRIMQSNYDIALDILGREKPEKFKVHDAVIAPK